MKRLVSLLMCLALLLSLGCAEELEFIGGFEEETYSDEEILELLGHDKTETSFLTDCRDLGGELTILTHYSLSKYNDYFEQLTGCKVTQIICGVQEYSSKLQSLIASGEAPDLVVSESSTAPLFMVLAKEGLVQPFDPYIDYSLPEFTDLRSFYEAGRWNGLHYLAPFDNKPLYYLIYDRNLFEEYGVETPWEHWLDGDWTWDTFRETVQQMNISNGEGGYVCYGTTACAYGALTGSTGVDYVEVGDGTIKVNITDPAIARAENYLNDMMYKDGVIRVKAQNAWSGYWNRGMLAMQIIDSWMIDQADVTNAIEDGRLGICPLPQDPEYNVPGEYHTYSQAGGFCLVNGAKNPDAAAMYIRMLAYIPRYGDPFSTKTREESLEALHEKGWDNELLYQYYGVCRDTSSVIVSFGYSFMANNKIWVFMAQQNNWTSFIEGILPGLEESIREILEG